MRYAFTQEARSIFNRANACLNDVPLDEYGSLPFGDFFIALWAVADDRTDWDGEEYVTWELYPELEKAWNGTIMFPISQSSDEHLAEDLYYQANKLVGDFENLIWLSIICVNAINALEGSPVNWWAREDREDRINAEFGHDRANFTERIGKILRESAILSEALRS